jgi:hypothetical protein
MTALLLACFIILSSSAAQGPRLDERWLYVSDPLRWERGYRPGEPPPELAQARILILEPSGTFASIWCSIYQRPDGRFSIIYSEGYTMTAGEWAREQKQILVRYHTIYSNVLTTDRFAEEEKQETMEYAPAEEPGRLASWLRSPEFDTRFVPLIRLDDLNGLADVIAFHKSHKQR